MWFSNIFGTSNHEKSRCEYISFQVSSNIDRYNNLRLRTEVIYNTFYVVDNIEIHLQQQSIQTILYVIVKATIYIELFSLSLEGFLCVEKWSGQSTGWQVVETRFKFVTYTFYIDIKFPIVFKQNILQVGWPRLILVLSKFL